MPSAMSKPSISISSTRAIFASASEYYFLNCEHDSGTIPHATASRTSLQPRFSPDSILTCKIRLPESSRRYLTPFTLCSISIFPIPIHQCCLPKIPLSPIIQLVTRSSIAFTSRAAETVNGEFQKVNARNLLLFRQGEILPKLCNQIDRNDKLTLLIDFRKPFDQSSVL